MAGQPPAATILCPLSFERRSLERSLADFPLRFEQCGPGDRGIEHFFAEHPTEQIVSPLILTGLGGSTSAEIVTGTAVVASEVSDESSVVWQPTWPPDHTHVVTGRISSTPTILRTKAERLAFAGTRSVDVADQESVAFARIASTRAISWGIVRGVSDDLASSLPHHLHRWVDEHGDTRVLKCACDVILRPSDIGRIIQLAKHSRMAMQQVAEVLRLLLTDYKNNPGHQAYQRENFAGQLDAPVSEEHPCRMHPPQKDAPP